jgi:hypothetical protein
MAGKPTRTNTYPDGEVIEGLARALYDAMEKHDPLDDPFVEWGDLPERDRQFYRVCIRELGARRGLLRRLADDNEIGRHIERHE